MKHEGYVRDVLQETITTNDDGEKTYCSTPCVKTEPLDVGTISVEALQWDTVRLLNVD